MSGATEWRRVEGAGCVTWGVRVFLLGWVVAIPYFVVHWDAGWLTWSCACAVLGIGLLVRERRRMRVREIPGTVVEVRPEGEWIVVRLVVGEELQRKIRWWKASLVAASEDEETVVSEAEFAVDPPAEGEPVTELEMTVGVPSGIAEQAEWFVRVMVETDGGRLVSGKVLLRVVGDSMGR